MVRMSFTAIKKAAYTCVIIGLFAAFQLSCTHKAAVSNVNPVIDTPVEFTPDTLIAPVHFPEPVIPNDNKPCKERIQLGRMLYYDTILSDDGRACAGCHLQINGFTRPGLYNNAMPVLPHVNLAWYTNFMWDGSKQGSLENVMLFEVSSFFSTDLNKINQSAKYKPLFKRYFGVSQITYKELAYSLAQFLRSVISRDSKYDRIQKGTATFTSDEYAGYRIFFTEKGDCFHCHINPITTDNQFHNTGLDSVYTKDADKGYYNVTGNNSDLGKFRTPNLRNVALRSHFMHDGRFTSLAEVIDFYDHGMHKVANLDPIMALPAKEYGLQLEPYEKIQLIAFLQTLTDSTFISDPDFSAPAN
jgi:cytochrome c peroxidase